MGWYGDRETLEARMMGRGIRRPCYVSGRESGRQAYESSREDEGQEEREGEGKGGKRGLLSRGVEKGLLSVES